MNFPWDQLLVKGNWMITAAQIGAFLVIAVIAVMLISNYGNIYTLNGSSVDHKNRLNVFNLCSINVRSWWY